MKLKQADTHFASVVKKSKCKPKEKSNPKKLKNDSHKKTSNKKKRKAGNFIINTNQLFAFMSMEKRQPFRRHNSFCDKSNIKEKIHGTKQRLSLDSTTRSPIIAVEDVTKNMINNICKKLGNKKLSNNGTSCHQCQQKTMDQKTCCRNVNCVGTRGQFCGVCLKNR